MPIGRKITITVLLATLTSILLSAVSLLSMTWLHERERIALHLAKVSAEIHSNSSVTLNGDNKLDAAQNLNIAKAYAGITMACLYRHSEPTNSAANASRPEKQQLNVFAASAGDISSCPQYSPREQGQLFQQSVHHFSSMSSAGETVGYLYLQQDTNTFWQYISPRLLALAISLIVGLVLAFVLARLLRRSIVQPLNQLADDMEMVNREQNYQLRSQLSADDEMGQLAIRFNQLLESVGRQQQDAVSSPQTVEEHLQERTQALQAANTKLDKSYRTLQSFTLASAHHLQDPVRKIQAFGDILTTRYTDQLGEQAELYLNRMRSAATQMRKQLDDIHIYADLEQGEKPTTLVDLNSLLDNLIRSLAEPIKNKEGHVLKGRLPQISGHRTQLWQLFEHLLHNSITFSSPDRMLQISITAEQDERGWQHIRVADNGIGFEPGTTTQIFEVFERLDPTTGAACTSGNNGSGVGLAVCERIAILHGGYIVAEGMPNQGAVFTVVLPNATPTDVKENPSQMA